MEAMESIPALSGAHRALALHALPPGLHSVIWALAADNAVTFLRDLLMPVFLSQPQFIAVSRPRAG